MTGRRANRWLVLEVAAVVTVLAVIAAVLLVVGRDRETGSPSAPALPTSAANPGDQSPVLAIKIDNVPEALPQTGIGAAAVVYVEPVEGGLTRLVAVYTDQLPELVGPVRSARRTDLELLAQYGKPVLSYSGAAPELLPALHEAGVVNASPAEAASAYQRARERAAPHNLYVRPERLPDGAVAPAVAPLRFGATPTGGAPVSRHEVTYPAARFTFTWSGAAGRWLVAMNGEPMVSTESGQLTAATVVVQRVVVTTNEPIEDAHGTVSPVARAVGAGPADVLRDGLRFTGTWTRPDLNAPTSHHTTTGQDLPLATGPVWVLLLAN